MIYWNDVRTQLVAHCPDANDKWSLYKIINYLNKEERLSMQAIADLTEGRCGRTSLCLKMDEMTKNHKYPKTHS